MANFLHRMTILNKEQGNYYIIIQIPFKLASWVYSITTPIAYSMYFLCLPILKCMHPYYCIFLLPTSKALFEFAVLKKATCCPLFFIPYQNPI